jgi:hypothetical protein
VTRRKKIGDDRVAFLNGQIACVVEKLLFIHIALAFGAQIDENPFRRNFDNQGFHFFTHGEALGGGVGFLEHFSKSFCVFHILVSF